jgi:hypothetical protein
VGGNADDDIKDLASLGVAVVASSQLTSRTSRRPLGHKATLIASLQFEPVSVSVSVQACTTRCQMVRWLPELRGRHERPQHERAESGLKIVLGVKTLAGSNPASSANDQRKHRSCDRFGKKNLAAPRLSPDDIS